MALGMLKGLCFEVSRGEILVAICVTSNSENMDFDFVGSRYSF